MNEQKTNGRIFIGEVAKQAGVNVQTIKRWSDAGKIPQPLRDRNNRRFFSEEQVAVIREYSFSVNPSAPRTQTTEEIVERLTKAHQPDLHIGPETEEQ